MINEIEIINKQIKNVRITLKTKKSKSKLSQFILIIVHNIKGVWIPTNQTKGVTRSGPASYSKLEIMEKLNKFLEGFSNTTKEDNDRDIYLDALAPTFSLSSHLLIYQYQINN